MSWQPGELDDEMVRRCSVHEAGHAIAAALGTTGRAFDLLELYPTDRLAPAVARGVETLDGAHTCRMLIAGRAAEWLDERGGECTVTEAGALDLLDCLEEATDPELYLAEAALGAVGRRAMLPSAIEVLEQLATPAVWRCVDRLARLLVAESRVTWEAAEGVVEEARAASTRPLPPAHLKRVPR